MAKQKRNETKKFTFFSSMLILLVPPFTGFATLANIIIWYVCGTKWAIKYFFILSLFLFVQLLPILYTSWMTIMITTYYQHSIPSFTFQLLQLAESPLFAIPLILLTYPFFFLQALITLTTSYLLFKYFPLSHRFKMLRKTLVHLRRYY